MKKRLWLSEYICSLRHLWTFNSTFATQQKSVREKQKTHLYLKPLKKVVLQTRRVQNNAGVCKREGERPGLMNNVCITCTTAGVLELFPNNRR